MSADGESIMQSIASFAQAEKSKLRESITSKNGIVFIFIGQLIDRKGISQLIINWQAHTDKYANDKLLIIGDGELKNEIIEFNNKNNSVIYLGSIGYDEIYKYYSVADVFLLPTLEDNWSLVVPEAMAASLPIATTIYNGCYPELVKKDLNGFVFDPLNENSFQETLAYFKNKDLKQMGKESFLIQKNYTAQKVAQRIFDGIV